jgi:hypothetical protein
MQILGLRGQISERAFPSFTNNSNSNCILFLMHTKHFYISILSWNQGLAQARQVLHPWAKLQPLWGLNSRLQACKAGPLLLEPHLQSISLWLFGDQGLVNYLPGWPWATILLISASQVAGITGMSHWHLAQSFIFILSQRNFLQFCEGNRVTIVLIPV